MYCISARDVKYLQVKELRLAGFLGFLSDQPSFLFPPRPSLFCGFPAQVPTATSCWGSRSNPLPQEQDEPRRQPPKRRDHTFPAPCPASSGRKLQFMLIRCGGWPKYFVSFPAQKGNEATSVSVGWHGSKQNNWETCFKEETQSTNSPGFTLPLGAELCLFPPFFQAGCSPSHKSREGWGRARRLFLRISFRQLSPD